MKRIVLSTALAACLVLFSNWGFFGHERINRLAVFILPPEMIGFYKANLHYIVEAAVNPDRRRYSVKEEAPRHYIDLDHYGDSVFQKMPQSWNAAVAKYSEDTLQAYGIVPWHINRMYHALREAFQLRDPARILKVSAELGHYVADAHVPLHTTENYNGQLTGQEGIHGFWESRLPELFSDRYDFFVGKAEYISNPQQAAWKAVKESHRHLGQVLDEEKKLSEKMGDKKYTFETKGRQTAKVYAPAFAAAYHRALQGMVEQRMREAIKMVGDLWFTAWVDAGQPDLKSLIGYTPSEAELAQRRAELERWKKQTTSSRPHEN
ncbi:zinc dependent phospholipase C family protein [Chryseolinea soli]|nr:zinc dependent phospholipase C family protein [Chryseolinea soli]